jgi:hypothetical protein
VQSAAASFAASFDYWLVALLVTDDEYFRLQKWLPALFLPFSWKPKSCIFLFVCDSSIFTATADETAVTHSTNNEKEGDICLVVHLSTRNYAGRA